MSEFSTVINYLKDTLASDTNVTTVSHGTSEEIDLDKTGTFPLAHVQITNSQIAEGYIAFTFEIHALKQRLETDTEIANLDICFDILNRLIMGLRLTNNEFDIELLDSVSPEPVVLDFENMLDGWKTTIQLQISNGVSLC